MNANTTLNDKAMIDESLRRLRAAQPGIPAEKVKIFIANIGKEIDRTGGLAKDHVDRLLEQLKNGEL
jgi:hypothetical protein